MSQQKILRPLTAKILLTIRDLTDIMISNTALLPRIRETQVKAFSIHDTHLTKIQRLRFNPQTRGKLTRYGRVTTCLWDTCFKGWCRWRLSWHFQCWKSFGSRICIWKLCLNSQYLESINIFHPLSPWMPFSHLFSHPFNIWHSQQF